MGKEKKRSNESSTQRQTSRQPRRVPSGFVRQNSPNSTGRAIFMRCDLWHFCRICGLSGKQRGASRLSHSLLIDGEIYVL